MSTYARIQNGTVAELFSPPTGVSITECFHPDLTWVECDGTPGVAPGWTYSLGVFAAPVAPKPTLAQQAQAMLSAGCQIASTGTPALNATYAVDSLSQMHVVAVETSIAAGKGLPGGGGTVNWPDVTGALHAFTAANFSDFAAALRDFVFALSAIVASNSGTLPAQPVTIA